MKYRKAITCARVVLAKRSVVGGFLSGFGLLGSGKEEENREDLIYLLSRFHSILRSVNSVSVNANP